MVALRAHRAAAKSAAVNDESLRQLLDVCAERSEHRRGRCEPVGFLEPEPRGIHNARLPFRRRSERAERGDKIGDGRGVDDRAVKRAAPHRDARGRFLRACSHRAENIKHGAVALRGIGAQAGNGDAAARESAHAEEERRRGIVPLDLDRGGQGVRLPAGDIIPGIRFK